MSAMFLRVFPLVFLRVVAMEWRKQRRSLAGWAIVAGACFTPAAVLFVRLLQRHELPRLYAEPGFWRGYWNSAWESVVVFLLPMCVILVTALLAQLEHRNTTWKQVSVLPVAQTTIYLAKLLVAVALVAQFLLLFVAAGALGALLPAWILDDVTFPAAVAWWAPVEDAALYFALALPIVVAQFAISLRVSNFLVPVGTGFLLWIAALALLSWRHAYLVPYGHGIQAYLASQPAAKVRVDAALLHGAAGVFTALFLLAGLVVFVRRPVKG